MMKKIVLSVIMLLALSACSELELGSHVAKSMHFPSDEEDYTGDFKVGNPYEVKGRKYYPSEKYHSSEVGVASWYGPGFNGKQTANGEIFNKNELTAAHKTLQMPSIVRVTNLENGKSIIVRVNDRGPFANDRIIDLSEKAAEAIDMKRKGTARVRVDVLEKESRMVASAAKQGLSTRGTELALNRGQKLQGMTMQIATPVSKPNSPHRIRVASIQPIQIAPPTASQQNGFNRMLNTQISPVNNVQTRPLQKVIIGNTATPRIASKPASASSGSYYVQTGAFHNEDNAMTMKMALYNVQEPVNIYRLVENGTPVYKVKIGPVRTVEKADEILRLLNKQGRAAKMVVAQN
tara:strand:+ start:170 stop:1216 length:1047 start_codon:yes stop_codon:yes gene_type:complete